MKTVADIKREFGTNGLGDHLKLQPVPGGKYALVLDGPSVARIVKELGTARIGASAEASRRLPKDVKASFAQQAEELRALEQEILTQLERQIEEVSGE